VQARQGPASPQPPSNGDRISLLRLAEHVSRNTGPLQAARAIREKWLTGALHFWVQWILGHSFGTPRKASVSLGEEPAPPAFLDDLEQSGLTAPGSNWRGLTFQNIIDASELGLYLDRRSARLFTSRVENLDGRSAACLFASRVEAARFWPWLDDRPNAEDQPKATQGRRSARGAPAAYDWEGVLIEACAFIVVRGLPETQAGLVAHIAEWFGDDAPADSTIKDHIAPLYQRIERELGR
jgi:hypothetical protein